MHPDILTTAKGIGGGFPMSACLATADAAKGLTLGVHGTTFGGNPMAMAIGNAVLDIVLAPGFMEHVARDGASAASAPRRARGPHPRVIEEIRGEGLMVGVKLGPAGRLRGSHARRETAVIPAGDNVSACFRRLS